MSRETIPIAGLSPPKVLRYQMPSIKSQIQGSKTIIENLSLIAKALHRSVEELVKFFAIRTRVKTELKSLSINAKGKPSPPVTVIKLVLTRPELQDLLAEFIEYYVLCSNCQLPETNYDVEANQLHLNCNSCHGRLPVEIESFSKLTSYIIDGFLKRQHVLRNQGSSVEQEQSKYWDITSLGPLVFHSTKSLMSDEATDQTCTSSPSVESPSHNPAATLDFSFHSPPLTLLETGIERYQDFLTSQIHCSIETQVTQLQEISREVALRSVDCYIIFLGAVFTDQLLTEKEITRQREVLKALAPSPPQQRYLLSGMQWFCGSRYPSLLRSFSKVLMALYEEDIIEEEIYLTWAADFNRNQHSLSDTLLSEEVLEALRHAAQPFLRWLQEAEEEEEEEEDDEESDRSK